MMTQEEKVAYDDVNSRDIMKLYYSTIDRMENMQIGHFGCGLPAVMEQRTLMPLQPKDSVLQV